jgi:hypothetical protein
LRRAAHNRSREKTVKIKKQLGAIGFLLVISAQATIAQSLSNPAAGYSNTIGVAINRGFSLDNPETSWGVEVDYSRVILDNWVFSFTFSYNRERDDADTGGPTFTNTLAPTMALGYIISSRFVVGIGLGKGLFDDANESKKLKYNPDGPWTLGLVGVYTLYRSGQHGIDASFGIERGLTKPETEISFELSYSLSF